MTEHTQDRFLLAILQGEFYWFNTADKGFYNSLRLGRAKGQWVFLSARSGRVLAASLVRDGSPTDADSAAQHSHFGQTRVFVIISAKESSQ